MKFYNLRCQCLDISTGSLWGLEGWSPCEFETFDYI